MRIDRTAFDNARPVALADLEILVPRTDRGRTPAPTPSRPGPDAAGTPVPLRAIRIAGTLAGSIAGLTIEQRFEIPGAPDGDPIDARYRFPVPPGAAVQAVTMRFGDEVIEAVLRERQEAQDRFDQAKATGRAAVLVTDSGRGVLTLSATGITPGIPLTVETRLVALPRRDADGLATLRIPLATGIRYVRDDEPAEAHEVNPALLATHVPFAATLDLRVEGGLRVTSPSHTITVTPGDDGAQNVRLDVAAAPDRDLVIETRPAAGDRLRGDVLLGETREGRTPWLATIVAPDATTGAAEGARLGRSLVLLVDRSGSMGGAKWATASWAVRSLVAGMTDADSLQVLAFDNVVERSGPGLTPMDPPARAAVTAWIRSIDARGGTELGPALQEALAIKPRGGTQAELLVVTDGEVSDAARILALLDETHWRVSVLCIDSAPNTMLASSMAERGGGESWFVASTPDAEDITDAVDRITAGFATPSVGDLVLEAPAGGAVGRVSTRGSGIAVTVGALPAGGVRLLAGWADDEPTSFRVTGTTATDLPVAKRREPAINALVAAARIRILEQATGLAATVGDAALVRREAERAGLDPATLPATGSVYPRGRHGDQADADPLEAALAAEVVRSSLDGRVLSSRTAFVGVRTKAGKRSGEQVDVPSMLPDGWNAPLTFGIAPMMASPMAGGPAPMAGGPAPMASLANIGGGIVSEALPRAFRPLMRTSGAGSRARRIPDGASSSTPPFILRLAVDELLAGVERAAPGGRWSVVRVTGSVAGAATGAWLVIWTTDRTQPLFRARLADLLAAGERPASLDLAAGTALRFAIDGGALTGGDLVIELGG